MKRVLLPLLLLLPVTTSCGDAVDAAEGAAGALKEAAAAAVEKAKNIDVSNMTPDALKDAGGDLMSAIGKQLSSIKDKADVDALKSNLEPIVDKLTAVKDKLGAKLPNSDELKGIVDDVKSKFANDGAVMESLQPMLEKVQSLFN